MASSAAASRRLTQTWHSLRTGSAAASVEELPELKFEVREDNVAVITLNNPEQLNPMGETMLQSFHQALQKVENPKSGIRALLITGAGRAFCSGANLTAGGGGDGGPPQAFSSVPGAPAAASLEAMYNPIISRLRDLRVPIVAAVNGPCAGVGMSFAMVADIVIANESAFFLQAFRNIGLVPDGGATFMLPRLVGWGRAMEMAMMGERVQADKALEWGLVNEVHSDDTMVDVAIEKAADLAAGPTQTLALIRQMYWASTRVRPRTPAAGPLLRTPNRWPDVLWLVLAAEHAGGAARVRINDRLPHSYPASPLTKLVLLLISGWRTRTRLLRAPAPMPVRVGSPLSRNAPPSSQAAPRLRRLRPRTSEHATMKRYTDLHPALKSLQHYTKAQHSLSAAGIRVILLNQQRLTARRSSSGL